MAFTEDLSAFFGTDDFAVDAVITLSSGALKKLKVIFNTPTQDVAMYDQQIEADAQNFTAQTADLTGAKNGNSVKIGAKTYKIARIADDGTGVSTVYLK